MIGRREIDGLLDAAKAFDLAQGMILTYDEFDRIDVAGCSIEIQPVWYWMLKNRREKITTYKDLPNQYKAQKMPSVSEGTK
jgi:hypothetical protein